MWGIRLCPTSENLGHVSTGYPVLGQPTHHHAKAAWFFARYGPAQYETHHILVQTIHK
jgi:hypothetical protein